MAVKWQKKDAQALSAAEMLAQSNRVVVVRPDADSQLRIVQQLIDNCPDTEILWLLPERRLALRQGQLKFKGLTLPQRVQLLSCEALAAATAEQWVELAVRRPQIAVLDGYQEVGAKCWNRSVRRLLLYCPALKLLGLTEPDHPAALNWDADDLFRDALGSQCSVAETLANGILPAPQPLAVILWPWENALETVRPYSSNMYVRNLEHFPGNTWNTLFQTTRHAAEGQKNLIWTLFSTDERCLVLCENALRMHEMMSHAATLFGRRENEVRCYCVTGGSLTENDAWTAFCADSEPGLQLLLCMDVPEVEQPAPGFTRALLLRKSQETFFPMLCHALAICGTSVPVVDVSEGFDTLTQGQLLRAKCRALTAGEAGKGECFPIEEPMRRCVQPYRQLREELQKEWDYFYSEAKNCYEEQGALNLPRGAATSGGVILSRWLGRQRIERNAGRLSAECVAKLSALDFDWRQSLSVAWESGYAAAKKYRSTFGNLLVPVRYVDENGFSLGEWIVYNRQRYANGNVNAERMERLEALGMVWSTMDNLWEQGYAAALHYYVEHGDLMVPVKYTAPDGLALGIWLCSQRTAYRDHELSAEQIECLNAIEMDWVNRNDRRWDTTYQAAVRYWKAHGNLNVPAEYVDEDGVMLGKWISRQRYALQNPTRSSARVTPERKAMLDELGMIWEKEDPWMQRYQMVLDYRAAHNGRSVPSLYKTEDGVWLGSWLARQRLKLQREGGLTPEQRTALKKLFRDEEQQQPSDNARPSVRDINWRSNYRSACAYAEEHGDLMVPAGYVDKDGFRLGVWISNLRSARKNRPDSFQVTPEHIAMLDAIGMQWDAREAKWDVAMSRAREYYEMFGDLCVPINYKTADGFCLGDWLRRVRVSRASGDKKLSQKRIAELDALGMQWKEKCDN